MKNINHIVAKNLLLGKTCMNCQYFSNINRLKTTHKKQQCFYSNKQAIPLPKKLTCRKWDKAFPWSIHG